MIELSVIIPTYKEEVYLPRLLRCLKKQMYKNFEIIVADKPFKDKTRAIAKRYGCKIVKGGSVSFGRNNGARYANGKYLLFLDADITFGRDFLKKYIKFFKDKNLAVSTCWSFALEKDHKFSSVITFIFMNIGNIGIFLSQIFKPMANGFCILIKKDIHEKIKGFDEAIEFGEDSDYVERAVRYGKFRICLRTVVYSSVRRFVKYGTIKMCLRYIYLNIKRVLFGNFKKKIGYFEG